MVENRISELQTIGLGLERDGRIRLAEHDGRWALEFSREVERISTILKNRRFRFFHIGSTSIPGIRAKPIIDILLLTPSLNLLDTASDGFAHAGYEVKGEFGLEGRRYYVLADSKSNKAYVHIHAWEEDHPQVLNHLIFRDYLRHHPVRAKNYENLKVELVDEKKADRSTYMDLKAPLIDEILAEAKVWALSSEARMLCSTEWIIEDSSEDREGTR